MSFYTPHLQHAAWPTVGRVNVHDAPDEQGSKRSFTVGIQRASSRLRRRASRQFKEPVLIPDEHHVGPHCPRSSFINLANYLRDSTVGNSTISAPAWSLQLKDTNQIHASAVFMDRETGVTILGVTLGIPGVTLGILGVTLGILGVTLGILGGCGFHRRGAGSPLRTVRHHYGRKKAGGRNHLQKRRRAEIVTAMSRQLFHCGNLREFNANILDETLGLTLVCNCMVQQGYFQ
ncbi:unnamed protein product [Nesidiocoris tenuis]|uniref:Uncharacterized protein n=1 Tax=Nesidiocoris tenuis TaxID=355587 RepID=A0A6H5H1C4_9HEMI|nr:unnamed protein product [Nesidiocoris tenuis]